jgi:hypothetical protein
MRPGGGRGPEYLCGGLPEAFIGLLMVPLVLLVRPPPKQKIILSDVRGCGVSTLLQESFSEQDPATGTQNLKSMDNPMTARG